MITRLLTALPLCLVAHHASAHPGSHHAAATMGDAHGLAHFAELGLVGAIALGALALWRYSARS